MNVMEAALICAIRLPDTKLSAFHTIWIFYFQKQNKKTKNMNVTVLVIWMNEQSYKYL